MANIKVILSAITDAFNRDLDGASKKINVFGETADKRLKSLAIPAGIAATALAAIGISAVKAFAQAEGVANAFQRFNDPTLLDGLRDATKGTVSDFELMKNAVQASNFKLPLDQLASLMEFASRRAKDTGESVDYLVSSIVTGIGRKSPLILDNLGISAAALKDELGGAAVAASSIADVTAAVGRIASAELEKMGADSDTFTEKFLRIKTVFENEFVGMGETISKALNPVIDGIEKVVLWFQDLSPEVKDAIVYVGAGAAAFLGLVAAAGAIVTIAPLVAGAISLMTLGIAAVVAAVGVAAVAIISNWKEISLAITQFTSDALSAISKMVGAIASLGSVLNSTALIAPMAALRGAQAGLAASAEQVGINARGMRIELAGAALRAKEAESAVSNLEDKANGLAKGLGEVAKKSEISRQSLKWLLKYRSDVGEASVSPTTSLTTSIVPQFQGVQQLKPKITTFATEAAKMVEDTMGPLLANGLGGAISGSLSAIGDAIANGENPIKAFGESILGSIGDILVQFGKLTVAAGVAATGLAAALSSPLNPASGVAAIAAGAALVAIGGLVKSFSGSTGSGGGASVSSPGSGVSGGSSNTSRTMSFSNSDNRTVTFEIAGTKLVGVLRNAGQELSRYGG